MTLGPGRLASVLRDRCLAIVLVGHFIELDGFMDRSFISQIGGDSPFRRNYCGVKRRLGGLSISLSTKRRIVGNDLKVDKHFADEKPENSKGYPQFTRKYQISCEYLQILSQDRLHGLYHHAC